MKKQNRSVPIDHRETIDFIELIDRIIKTLLAIFKMTFLHNLWQYNRKKELR